jgi:AcrR family transcriptional regulator
VETSEALNPPRAGARQLARRAMIAQISQMAIDLFSEHGYEETTIEDICAVAGISRSSFFRYFQSKEDVLLGTYLDIDGRLLSALIARAEDETPWVAIRWALDPLIEHYNANAAQTLRSAKLVIKTPTLVTSHRDKLTRWVRLLTPEIARRLNADPGDLTDPRPAALIGAALACLDATLAAWAVADGAAPLAQLLDRTMAAIS